MTIFFRSLFFGFIISSILFSVSCKKEVPPVPLIAPEIANQSLLVGVSSGSGTVVGVVIASTKNADEILKFSIIDGNTGKSFRIDECKCSISVLNSVLLAPGGTTTFTLKVQVVSSLDANIKSSAIVDISVLKAPVIETQSFTVAENSPVGTIIGSVAATAINANESLVFSIRYGNMGETFKIDASSGQLTVKNNALLKPPENADFILTIEIASSVIPNLKSSAQAKITMLFAPVIAAQSFNVVENSPAGTFVGVVDVSPQNPGEGIKTWSIIDGNVDDAFEIRSTSGKISVKSSTPINFASNTSFQLTIEVESSLSVILKGTGVVTINIIDISLPVKDGIIAYYPFRGDTNDESGNGLNGIANGGVTFNKDRFGLLNSSCSFDGINDYIDLGKSGLFNFGGYTNYSMSFWIKPAETGFKGERVILGIYGNSLNQRIYRVGLRADAGDKLIYRMFDQGKIPNQSVQTSYNLNWQHVVILATGNIVKIYVNNIKVEEQVITISMLPDAFRVPAYIGAVFKSSNAPDLYFKGEIDDIALYNRALSESEINSLYGN